MGGRGDGLEAPVFAGQDDRRFGVAVGSVVGSLFGGNDCFVRVDVVERDRPCVRGPYGVTEEDLDPYSPIRESSKLSGSER